MRTTDWLSFAVSFGTVLALLGTVLYLVRRLQRRGMAGLPQRRIRILDSLSVGPRQKIVLLRVKEQDILIGISVQQISTLASFAPDDSEAPPVSDPVPDTAAGAGGEPLGSLAARLSDRLKALGTGQRHLD